MDSEMPYEEVKKQKITLYINKRVNNAILSETQRETLNKFFQDLRLGKKINFVVGLKRAKAQPTSYMTFRTYMNVLINFGEFVKKDFIDVTKEDIENYQLMLQTKTSKKTGFPIKAKTIEFYSVILKIFYIWLYGEDEIPDLVKDIEVTNKPQETIKENEVLTPKEVKSIIDACKLNRDKALIALLYESGARAGELINANVGDFVNHNRYGDIILRGKTGERTVTISDSVIYIEQWLNQHPNPDNLDFPLFTSYSWKNCNQRLSNVGIWNIIRKRAKLAGIKKKVYPHWFRHSSVDYYAKRYNANERELRIRYGWTPKSPMPTRYLHYGEKEVNANYLRNKGIEIKKCPKDEYKILEPKICTRCKELYPNDESKWLHSASAKYCTCGQVLDLTELKRVEQFKEETKKFTNILLEQPIPNNLTSKNDLNQIFTEMVLRNPLLLEKFNLIKGKYNI